VAGLAQEFDALEIRRTNSNAAFRELVARFVDLVYSTALRLVEGDTHRAEDVTQTVFVDLARLARTRRGTAISDFPIRNKSFNLSYCGFDL
jgi:DNA-directed RNA polymerase specialized sigma24 family protein